MSNYQNPIKRHGDGDLADPFVLRYNGKYYLYCTNPLINCWSSYDLQHWQAEGPVIDGNEFPGLVPFAPEVVYWNGFFYMYTSPHGFGHYVLKSPSPTGPFHKITDNVHHNIDLSLFVDDDGAWYAYWADDRGIVGCRMKSPTEFGEEVLVGATMHGWTEGPFVIKRGGKYHLTYTGNHYLSKGYRINMAVADSPLGPFTDNPYNPLIVRTEGDVTGLGHSSTVLAPSLNTHYIIYHNINADATRDMDIDELVICPEEDYLLGPTTEERPAPAMPTWADLIPGCGQIEWNLLRGSWVTHEDRRSSDRAVSAISRQTLPASGVIEFNLTAKSSTQNYGVQFVQDDYAITLTIECEVKRLVLAANEEERAVGALLADFDPLALHTLRVEFAADKVEIYLDNLFVMQAAVKLEGCVFGYFADGGLRIGRTAVTDNAAQQRVYPLPGRIPANAEVQFEVTESGVYQICPAGGLSPVGTLTLDGLPMHSDTATIRATLTTGVHTFRTENSTAHCYLIEKMKTSAILPVMVENFGPYDKMCGSEVCSDVCIKATLHTAPENTAGQTGVLLRASELADGGEGADKVLGTNFFIGYRVCAAQGKLQLWKHRYDETLLGEANLPTGSDIVFAVELKEKHITVLLDSKAVITYTDADPILSGRYGFHTRNCMIQSAVLTSEK